MNTNQGIVRWLTSVLLIALLLQFARVTPSASAQGEETATPVLTDTPGIDVDQDGMYDDAPNESSLSSQQSFGPLSGESNLNSLPASIGMVQAGAYAIPRDRLTALGFSVTVIPPTSTLAVFQEYDVVYLPLAWTGNSSVYQTIESHASDYQMYVSGGGGLFVEQPNPCGYPGDEATPTLLPYPITFFCPYNPDDDPLIVDPNHFITVGLSSAEMPFPADQMINLDPAYDVLVTGTITESPSLVVANYGTGRVLVETAHPGYGAVNVFSDEVYRRMINWTASAYACSGIELSPVAQAVLAEVDSQEYCGNQYNELITLPPGEQAFQRFGVLAEDARYEVDFTTMLWDENLSALGDSPGRTFLSGIKNLYDKVQNPAANELPADHFSEGVRVRILIGLEKHYLDILPFSRSGLPRSEWIPNGLNQDQHARIMEDIISLGIEPEAPNWNLEVALYNISEPYTHSHAKLMIVDGTTVVTGGYNMQYLYLNGSDQRDMGVEVSGPIASHALTIFDKLWENAISCIAIDQYGKCVEATATLQRHPTLTTPAPEGEDVVFSLYRDHTDKTADDAIAAAISAASSRVNILQNRFMNPSTSSPLYARAVLDVLQKDGPQVNVNLLVSGGLDYPINSRGICHLENTLENEDPSKLQYLEARIYKNPMHTKALLVDDFVIVGSQNFDASAWGNDTTDFPPPVSYFLGGDLTEYSLGIDSIEVANEFNEIFNSEWGDDNSIATKCYNVSTTTNTLQDEIDQAEAGSAIILPDGIYATSVIVNKPLILIGTGTNTTIIRPAGSQPAFRITSSDVTIANMRISGGDGYGIELIDSSPSSLKNIQINRVVFENNTQGGILAQGLIPGSPMNYTIENNTFIGGADGVAVNMVETQADTSFIRNNIFSGQTNAPVHILSTDDSRVEYSYNLFNDCGLGVCTTNWIQGNMSAFSSAHDNLFDLDPLFASPENGAYQLSIGSPAVDAGDPSILHEFFFDGDNDGFIRIDMGAFEYAPIEENVAPVVDAGIDQTVQLGNPVTVSATYTDVDNTKNHSARINWGDGIVEDVPVTMTGPGAGEVVSEHNYVNAGNYTVEVCVTDLYGTVGCDTLVITVTMAMPVDLYLHGSGSTANPPILYLDPNTPVTTNAKYKDSSAVNFNNGNAWKEMGTWTASPVEEDRSLSTLDDLHVWLGLKNSDDVGTRFDLRAELYKNGELLVASGETLCITGLVRNANQAKEAIVMFAGFDPITLNSDDALSIKIFTRVGTDGLGNLCGGHANAVGLRLYFDSPTRPSKFGYR